MISGFQTYRYYTALKLHFTSEKYDVIKSAGRVKCSEETFNNRKDKYLFEKLGSQFSKNQDLVYYLIANFAYDNPKVIWSGDSKNYQEWIKRRDSRTRIFETDLSIIKNSIDPLNAFLANKVSIESLVILNQIDNFTNKVNPIVYKDFILKINKLTPFVKYSKEKCQEIYSKEYSCINTTVSN